MFRLPDLDFPDPGASLLQNALCCYDTIGDPYFDVDRDGILHYRSAYQFVFDQLSTAQRHELGIVDTFWRAHPVAFDDDFWKEHHWTDKLTAMRGWVMDEAGNVPRIPRSHWWWWPMLPERPERRTPPWLRHPKP